MRYAGICAMCGLAIDADRLEYHADCRAAEAELTASFSEAVILEDDLPAD